MNEFQQQILQKIEQIASKLQNYKINNQELINEKQELKAKIEYLERRESELVTELENNKSELSEKSQLTDLFTENKFWGWLGLLTIFILICSVLYFQLRIWVSEDELENQRNNNRKRKGHRSKK